MGKDTSLAGWPVAFCEEGVASAPDYVDHFRSCAMLVWPLRPGISRAGDKGLVEATLVRLRQERQPLVQALHEKQPPPLSENIKDITAQPRWDLHDVSTLLVAVNGRGAYGDSLLVNSSWIPSRLPYTGHSATL